jgi:hypothetical protein
MAVLGINYSQEIAERGDLTQNVEILARSGAMATGLVATGLSVALAPITFGGSLV